MVRGLHGVNGKDVRCRAEEEDKLEEDYALEVSPAILAALVYKVKEDNAMEM